MERKIRYNPSIHHRRSIRLKGYDYSRGGLYFITICSYNRECWFGDVINKKMVLNGAGKIAGECWCRIPGHFPNVVLHEHIVMPNHVHGIIEIMAGGLELGMEDQNVGVQNFEPLPSCIPKRNEFQKIIPRSVGSIIRDIKLA